MVLIDQHGPGSLFTLVLLSHQSGVACSTKALNLEIMKIDGQKCLNETPRVSGRISLLYFVDFFQFMYFSLVYFSLPLTKLPLGCYFVYVCVFFSIIFESF